MGIEKIVLQLVSDLKFLHIYMYIFILCLTSCNWFIRLKNMYVSLHTYINVYFLNYAGTKVYNIYLPPFYIFIYNLTVSQIILSDYHINNWFYSFLNALNQICNVLYLTHLQIFQMTIFSLIPMIRRLKSFSSLFRDDQKIIFTRVLTASFF